jgi:hypothetical protein
MTILEYGRHISKHQAAIVQYTLQAVQLLPIYQNFIILYFLIFSKIYDWFQILQNYTTTDISHGSWAQPPYGPPNRHMIRRLKVL